MIAGPPGVPVTNSTLPSLRTIVRVMADRGRFLGPMELASPWMRPYWFGTPGLEEKSSISLFNEETRAGDGEPGAVASIQRVRIGDRVTLSVDDGKVCRVLALEWQRIARAQIARQSCSVGVNVGPPFVRIFLRDEPSEGNGREIRVAKVMSAIGKGPFHDLRQQMDVFR